MSAPIQSIIILGGGTAGWMSAAALARSLGPSVAITLVESAEIGAIGVGEATIPSIKQFNAMLDIAEGDFLKATKATFKLGIQFNNWRTKGHSYIHPFGAYGAGQELGQFHQAYLMLAKAGRIDPDGADALDAYSICATAALQGKVTTQSADPASPYSRLHSAYHFDASLYAQFMRTYAESHGVKRVEGEVTGVALDPENGFVRTLTLKSGETLSADFFIDCSGFRAVLIEKALGVPYLDWSHWLPMDRAWAMPCEIPLRSNATQALRANMRGGLHRLSGSALPGSEDSLPGRLPYTVSTATQGGWMWRIPLQHRVGNGHVFSSAHMNEDKAADLLVRSIPGKALADPRLIRFKTGRRARTWEKNVVAIGLAGGFIEPLESTSIYFIQAAIHKMLNHMPDNAFTPANTAVYNEHMAQDYDQVRDVIIMHYHLTERDDSSLWNHVRTMTIPDALKQRLDVFKERGMIVCRPHEAFAATTWLAIMLGQGPWPQGYTPLMDGQDTQAAADNFRMIRSQIAQAVAPLPSQDAFLKYHKLIV